MKNRIILALAAVMIFGLAIATVGFSSASKAETAAAACCCCSGDSCPLKSKSTAAKDASSTDKASCCDGCEHCTNGSCPMMKDGAHTGEHAKGEHSCCGAMMKDAAHAEKMGHDVAKHSEHHDKSMGASCPMNDMGDAKSALAVTGAEPSAAAAADKTSCSCPCCAKSAEKQTVPSV